MSAQFERQAVHRAGVPGDLRAIEPGWWDLHGDRLLTPTADRETLRIVDPMGSEAFDVALPAESPGPVTSAELAGDFLGFVQDCCGRVFDWRTGRIVVSATEPDQGWISELEADGTALWGGSHSTLMGESATDGGGTRLGGLGPPDVLRMLGGGRTAYDDRARNEIVVTDLRGARLAGSPISRSAAKATTDDPSPSDHWDRAAAALSGRRADGLPDPVDRPAPGRGGSPS